MMRLACLSFLAVFSWGNVSADLLPPAAARLMERYSANPGSYDRTDAWCAGREIGSACAIPGSAFEGGGPGKCDRVMNRDENFIDFRCLPKNWPQIERFLPPGQFQAAQDLCVDLAREQSGPETLSKMGLMCAAPAPVSDRYCQGAAPGKSCVAEVQVGEQVERATGVCKSETEKRSFYFRGRQVATRPVVMCRPVNPREDPPMKPVSSWRKLIQ